MKDWKSFLKGDLLGVHLAVNIFVGTTLLWLLLRLGANTSPIWAISAMVASIDPPGEAGRGQFTGAHSQCASGLRHRISFPARRRIDCVEASTRNVGDRPALLVCDTR